MKIMAVGKEKTKRKLKKESMSAWWQIKHTHKTKITEHEKYKQICACCSFGAKFQHSEIFALGIAINIAINIQTPLRSV